MSSKQLYTIRISMIVALGGFLLGFDASVISGVLKFIRSEFNLSDIQVGWAVSSITLTAVIGMIVTGPMSDKYGRRILLKYAALLFTVSAIGSALAGSFFWLIFFRLIGGLAVGASLVIAPMYIAEIAPAEKRGQLVSINQLNIVLGISIAFFTNYLILQWGESNSEWSNSLGLKEWNWRWMLGIESLPAIIYFLGLFIVPRSPRWLLTKERKEEALDVIKRIASTDEEAEKQVEEVSKSIIETKGKEKSKVSDLFSSSMRKVIIIGLLVGVFQQLVGINAVLFYAPMIFEQTGMGTDASFIQAVLVGLTNLVFTMVAIYTIDKLGRKQLLIIGMAGITLCLGLLTYGFSKATYSLNKEAVNKVITSVGSEDPNKSKIDEITTLEGKKFENDLVFKKEISKVIGEEAFKKHGTMISNAGTTMNTNLILFSILGFVASFAVSIGPVMWVLFSELFPNKIRGLAISFVGFVNLGISFLVQFLFPWELSTFGNTITFLIFTLFALVGFVFIWITVPETKGKSLEELEEILVKE